MHEASLTFIFNKLFTGKDYVEEGDPCGEVACPGTMVLGPVKGCTCFISPPCSACMEDHPACDKCGWQDPDWEAP